MNFKHYNPAAFGRLCVETAVNQLSGNASPQPPSGGCVLKLVNPREFAEQIHPAAFGRLCVETTYHPQTP